MDPYIIFLLLTLGSMIFIGGICFYCITYGNAVDLENRVDNQN